MTLPLPVNQYVAGSLVRVTAAFTDSDGNPADPTTVTLHYRSAVSVPDTVDASYPDAPVVRDSQGNYHADLDTTPALSAVAAEAAENWYYAWYGTGAVQAAGEGIFSVLGPWA